MRGKWNSFFLGSSIEETEIRLGDINDVCVRTIERERM